ncbi:hypothetical protein EJ377_15820 [Chryseobacterium arthrosphaerae]|uniref:Uncharacterized protein n=1 Tax=Chryseobacterium arthrosphaerae TaxID=651561 RepID=A0A3S0N307_9FLAO|nr:hypothetical protein EJ377_15820 [Chryseobacterium arthrosphaerae]
MSRNSQYRFSIGSNTKSFTSALIGMLESEKKISVQDKPSDIFPI